MFHWSPLYNHIYQHHFLHSSFEQSSWNQRSSTFLFIGNSLNTKNNIETVTLSLVYAREGQGTTGIVTLMISL